MYQNDIPDNKFYEYNQRLVYYVISKEYYDFLKDEDVFQEGMIGLFKARKYYDKSKSHSFSSFAYTCIKNEIGMYLRKENRQMKLDLISLEEPVFDEHDSNDITIADQITSTAATKFIIDENVYISELDEKILKLSGQGYTQREIAKIFGCSQAQISRRLKHLRILILNNCIEI